MDERHDLLTLADREIHVTEWGDRANPPIILWHGLSRFGYDFEPLARRLGDDFWLIAPDAVGRGKSQWAEDPTSEYTMAFMISPPREWNTVAVSRPAGQETACLDCLVEALVRPKAHRERPGKTYARLGSVSSRSTQIDAANRS